MFLRQQHPNSEEPANNPPSFQPWVAGPMSPAWLFISSREEMSTGSIPRETALGGFDSSGGGRHQQVWGVLAGGGGASSPPTPTPTRGSHGGPLMLMVEPGETQEFRCPHQLWS